MKEIFLLDANVRLRNLVKEIEIVAAAVGYAVAAKHGFSPQTLYRIVAAARDRLPAELAETANTVELDELVAEAERRVREEIGRIATALEEDRLEEEYRARVAAPPAPRPPLELLRGGRS